MAERNSFKKYNRDYRVQTTEETFKEGQVFTRAPLTTGRHRLIVNYDLLNDGDSLTNRYGIRTTELCAPFAGGDAVPNFSEDLVISNGRDVIEEDGKHYRLFIANEYKEDATKLSNGLYTCRSDLYVTQSDEVATVVNPLAEYDISTKNFYAISLCKTPEDTSDALSLYRIPNIDKINGMSVNSKKFFSKPIGCFAFSNDYYCFNSNGDLLRVIYQKATETSKDTYVIQKVEPKEITPSEVTSFGYNMLLKDPYSFKNAFVTGNIVFKGIMLYKNDKAVAFPLINTGYDYKAYYTMESGKKYKIVWSYQQVGSADSWNVIKTEDITYTKSSTVTEPAVLTLTNFQCPFEECNLKVTAYLYSGGAASNTPEQEISYGMSFIKATTDSMFNRPLENYDLSSASGMLYWKNRLWLYGLAQAPTVLLASGHNEIDYFPYPHGADVFDEPIVTCVPFNDNMLVFTRTEIIQLTPDASGHWTKKTLQGNLNFSDIDADFVQVVKNMVFFKSGDYYYMIVPKTLSLQNELAIAPVSKNISYFLDDFEENAKTLFEVLYEYTGDISLVAHYNFLNYEDVHNVYTFKTDSGLLLNLVLLYNTVDRTWRCYTYESENLYIPLRRDATKQSIYMSGLQCNLAGRITAGVQLLEIDKIKSQDFYIPQNIELKKDVDWIPDDGAIGQAFEDIHTFKNWQVMDTGYRDQVLDLNKRYRELQIKFNNVGGTTIRFITEFILDGETRIGRYKYTTEHVKDPSSPNYGLISIVRTPVENLEMPGVTELAIDEDDINAWTLDCSRFPEIAYWKARLKVSGKGYTPRFRLICRTEERYELLGYTWVYRMMYSR